MTSRDFNHWLRGYLDVLDGAPLSGDHVKKIRDNLQKVTMSDYPAYPYTFTSPHWPYYGSVAHNTTPGGTLLSNGTAYTEATYAQQAGMGAIDYIGKQR